MAFRKFRRRGFRRSRKARRGRRSMRLRSLRRYRGRRFRRSRRRTFPRSSRFSGYQPQSRSIKSLRAYNKSSRVFGRPSRRGVIVTSRELVGVICAPFSDTEAAAYDYWTSAANKVTQTNLGFGHASAGPMNWRAHLLANKSKVNIYPCPGSKTYCAPAIPHWSNTKALDELTKNWLTGNASGLAPAAGSIPESPKLYTHYALHDGGQPDGYITSTIAPEGPVQCPSTMDALYCQPGTIFINFTPQSGQLERLSQNAQNYDKYRILAIQAQYITACSTSTQGTFMMQFQPNPASAPDYERGKIMRNALSSANSVYTNGVLYYKPTREWKFCTSPTDSKIYPQDRNGTRLIDRWSDTCNFFGMVDGVQPQLAANSPILGYVFMTYVVEFRGQAVNQNAVGNPRAGNFPFSLAPSSATASSTAPKKDDQYTDKEIMEMLKVDPDKEEEVRNEAIEAYKAERWLDRGPRRPPRSSTSKLGLTSSQPEHDVEFSESESDDDDSGLHDDAGATLPEYFNKK